MIDKLLVGITLIVGALGKLRVHLLNFGIELMQIIECLANLIFESLGVGKYHLLWQIAHHKFLGHRHRATSRRLQAGDNLQHRTFACTVLAHKCYAVFLVDDVAHAIKQGITVKFYR